MRFNRATQLILAAALVLSGLLVNATPVHGAAGFGDVEADRFYTTPIQWMVDSGITNGTSAGCFSPDRAVTRAEIATFLHRYAGEPGAGSEPFTDVKAGSYYRNAVAWMAGTGITVGTSPTTFEPDRAVTRGEIATFVHRFAGEPTPAADFANETPFLDTPDGAFFTVPVQWMTGAGITTGTSPITFEPYRSVTRGELATFLYRLAGSPDVTVTEGGTCGTAAEVDDDLATAEADSLSLLNELRISVGAAPLARIGAMDDFARNWSRTMSEGGFFAHSGGPYGENIVWWSNENLSPEEAAQRFHDMWADSPGHYQNMTHAGYTKVGIGLWRDENGWHGTHVFSY